MKVEYLTYHRNGVHGNPFYSCLVDGNRIATFETDITDRVIDIKTCREVSTKDFHANYRGDNTAFSLQSYFNGLMGQTKNICDLTGENN